MKKIYFLVGSLFLLNLDQISLAQEGTAVGQHLLQPIGSRAAAMGEAYATAEDDIFAIHYNPAAYLRSRQMSALYQEGLSDERFGVVGVGLPFKWGRLASTILYYNGGMIDLDDGHNNQRTITAQSDFMATVSASGSPFHHVQIGGNFKFIRSTLAQEFSSQAYLFDLGAQWRFLPDWDAGFAIQNLGTGLKYGSETESLPIVTRAGLSRRFDIRAQRILIAGDIVKQSDQDKLLGNIGAEYGFGTLMFLRAGYRIGQDIGTWTMGAGFGLSQYSFDYAFIPEGDFGQTSRFSLAMRF